MKGYFYNRVCVFSLRSDMFFGVRLAVFDLHSVARVLRANRKIYCCVCACCYKQ